jgi:hypothetical protein
LGTRQYYFQIDHGDCDYVSEEAQYSDYFEAFVSSNATSWYGGGQKLVSESSFTKLYTGLSGWDYFYVEDTGRDNHSDSATIAQ